MQMKITFPDGKKVNALYRGHEIRTDQDVESGGEGTAPEPMDLFLGAIGTCAGLNALMFCRTRKIPAEGLSVTLDFERDEEKHLFTKVDISIGLPAGFPEKYKKTIIRAVELCAVKKHLVKPPEFTVTAI